MASTVEATAIPIGSWQCAANGATGYYIAFSGTGGTAERPEYGWGCALSQHSQ
jgi:hypothetical protein